ncbi:putative membrane protein YpjA [Scopulibacillus darangshiensis]|uniref:Putative membrane protein YpjA n=1 Tax=Scopulibacillus darangshiensis TaxID=442528 RepID=A0A4R2PCH1_9BACL|nr:DUF1405 domain-containing protein [Scopulibacillus darangshiensis]TCP31625.1 putative membrane protein YpjA [Scopulibacillus darangshiensis]
MTGIYFLLKQKWVLWTLLIINLLGTVYGYYWYLFQLKDTPIKFMIFVPDSPTASLFFCIVLSGFLLKKHFRLFEALAAVTLFKYGVWAVGMNAVSSSFGYKLEFENWMLIFSHGCMAIEGLLYARFYRFKGWHLLIAAIWTVHNDFIDYIFGMAPWYPYLAANIQTIGYLTFWLSLISIGLVYLLAMRKNKLTLS